MRKLGIKPGFRVAPANAPQDYQILVSDLPVDVVLVKLPANDIDLVHYFCAKRSKLASKVPVLINSIKTNGTIWISWPKKSSKVPCDFTEEDIRQIALPIGLVDVKVCAVTEIWSGLKLVLRKENR